MPDENVSPIGMYNWGKSFINSALAVQALPESQLDEMRQRINIPAYYLIGHGLELLFKAYLLSVGKSVQELRSRNFGHNLEALMKASFAENLELHIVISEKERAIVRLLNSMYSTKGLEYFERGSSKLPKYSELSIFAIKFQNELNGYIRKHV